MENFIMAQGIPVRVFDSKKGERAIVLLHGYLETLSVWDDFAEALIKLGYRVISIDLPGHGLSGTKGSVHTMEFMAEVLNEVLNKANINQSVVIGHSMGGYAALAFAKKYSDKTQALCLFHSTPNADSEEKKINRDREIDIIQQGKLETVVGLSIPRMFANDNVKRLNAIIEEIEENALIAEPNGIIACLQGMKGREDMNMFLKEFSKPLLLIFGVKDNHISTEVAEALIERFPQAKTIMLKQSGHAGFIEEPEASLESVDCFLQTIS